MADTNFAKPAILTEQSSAATPPANTVALYPKTDGRFYGKDDAGTEFAIGTIGGTAGTVDNAVPRADGTGGGTLQGSDIVIDDATTSTANNVAITNQHAGQTNSSLVLTPKGTGALIAGPKPDGTAVGGNARGVNAVDLQPGGRNAATQVAAGANSVAIGYRASALGSRGIAINGTASGDNSIAILGSAHTSSVAIGNNTSASGFSGVAIGDGSTTSSGYVFGLTNNATGDRAICIGSNNNASFYGATAIGRLNTAQSNFDATCIGTVNNSSAVASVAIGSTNVSSSNFSIAKGLYCVSNRTGMEAYANGQFSALTTAQGDAQRACFVLRCKTTTNSAVEMALDGGTTYLGIPSGKVIACTINISGVKSDGSAVAHYVRQYAVKNVGGTSSEVYAPVTIGTDNAAGTVIALSANNTDDTLRIAVTGIASETWRWVASVDAVEIAYGT